jgi:AmiR/NasT family two-component response regulator
VAASQGGRESIEQEMDATREHLVRTIDQLVHRTSPKTIAGRQAQAVKAYFVDPQGAARTDHILKVVGGVAGVVAALVVLRKIVR